MDRRKVEEYLPKALEALESRECRIAKDGKIAKTFRGQISFFGAAVTMGSFKAAVAFFSDDGGSEVDRSELLRAADYVVNGSWRTAGDICKSVMVLREPRLSAEKERYLNASVALKLAMNAFELTNKSDGE